MFKFIAKILSRDSGPFWQFVKYGVIGVMSTLVQTGVFYALGATTLKCLKADDKAVLWFGLPSADVTDAERAINFAIATAIGFVIANVFCWLMNRKFVFVPGKYSWWKELFMFFGASTLAAAIALGLSSLLISHCGIMTSAAVIIEVVVSFLVNFFVRKFVIFKR